MQPQANDIKQEERQRFDVASPTRDGGPVRWDRLFADLEALAAAADTADFEAEVADRTRAEHAGIAFVDRLRSACGHPVVVTARGTGPLAGTVIDVGVDWLLLGGPGHPQVLVALNSVTAVSGLGRGTAAVTDRGPVYPRLDFRRALRGLAGQRSQVRLALADGVAVSGTLDRVGADFVELAEHSPGEPRRRTAVRGVQTVPIAAVAAVVRLDG